MNSKLGLSIGLLVLGVLILVVLVTVGGIAKKTVEDTIYSRLEYDLPDGYDNDPNYEECYRGTVAMFDEEYYLWNLTNLAAVLTGQKAEFNLTGPYSYTQWYCDYEHNINKETGYLTYRTYYEGYRFLRGSSSSDESDMITNVNPGYLALLQKLGDDTVIPIVMSGAALETIITSSLVSTNVWFSAVPTVLSAMNSQISLSIASSVSAGILKQLSAGITAQQFFDSSFNNPIQGWAYYVSQLDPSANTTLETASQVALFAAWQNSTVLLGFGALLTADTIASTFGVQATQAQLLKSYVYKYLLAADPTITSVISVNTKATLYSQWADNSLNSTSGLVKGWEIGIPTATGISATDVAALFSTSGSCALANSAGYQVWLAMLQADSYTSLAVNCSGIFTLTNAQTALVLQWINSYATNVVNATLASSTQFNLSTWDDFNWRQWGQQVAGKSLGSTFAPEIANFTSSSCAKASVTYTVDDAKSLFSGDNSLFNQTNMVTFFKYIQALSAQPTNATLAAAIISTWPGFSNVLKASCFAQYLVSVIQPYAIIPKITAAIAQGGGLFTTRSVNQWLFNAQDPLLALLKQTSSVGLMTNLTRTKAEADKLNKTYIRVYTGSNDLHWSLMPTREGEVLTFWRGDVTITGYNGSQFLPNGYLDKKNKPYPLELWNSKINRTIPFKNVGKDKWNGVNVRYLTLADDALSNEIDNPANYPYYATYSGAINKTSNPPNLPIFLTTPNFESAEKAFTENVTITDTIYDDYDPNEEMSRHRRALFILAEPTLGSSLWGNLPIQINFQYKPTGAFYKNILPSFAPIYWNAIGDIASEQDLDDVKNKLYVGITAWKVLIGVGVGVGVIVIVAGIVLVHHFKKHENELKEISTTSSTS